MSRLPGSPCNSNRQGLALGGGKQRLTVRDTLARVAPHPTLVGCLADHMSGMGLRLTGGRRRGERERGRDEGRRGRPMLGSRVEGSSRVRESDGDRTRAVGSGGLRQQQRS